MEDGHVRRRHPTMTARCHCEQHGIQITIVRHELWVKLLQNKMQ